jgi:DNA-binding NtrC family response regulator
MTNILIVEDESTLNEAYSIILKKEGYKVRSAYNGEEALTAIKEKTPDLLLLDLRMPKMDGVQLLKALQPLENYPKMKVIIFSNYDVQKEIDEAFTLGATRYMLKSWASPKELTKLVKDTLNNK